MRVCVCLNLCIILNKFIPAKMKIVMFRLHLD